MLRKLSRVTTDEPCIFISDGVYDPPNFVGFRKEPRLSTAVRAAKEGP